MTYLQAIANRKARREAALRMLDTKLWQPLESEFGVWKVRCKRCGKEYKLRSMMAMISHSSHHTCQERLAARLEVGQRWHYLMADRSRQRLVTIVACGVDRWLLKDRIGNYWWTTNTDGFLEMDRDE